MTVTVLGPTVVFFKWHGLLATVKLVTLRFLGLCVLQPLVGGCSVLEHNPETELHAEIQEKHLSLYLTRRFWMSLFQCKVSFYAFPLWSNSLFDCSVILTVSSCKLTAVCRKTEERCRAGKRRKRSSRCLDGISTCFTVCIQTFDCSSVGHHLIS